MNDLVYLVGSTIRSEVTRIQVKWHSWRLQRCMQADRNHRAELLRLAHYSISELKKVEEVAARHNWTTVGR